MISSLEKNEEETSRKHALEKHRKALKEVLNRGSILSVTLSTIVMRSDGSDITDFDGVSFIVRKSELYLLLVEAKKVRRGRMRKAREQLEEGVREAGLWDSLHDPQINELSKYGAYIFAKVKG